MSNTELHPDEVVCAAEDGHRQIKVLEPRPVPLGGLRAMTVRRTLPQRGHTLIGPWCFVDHYGPDDVAATGGMNVNRHPHTGLATVSWLFSGAIDHLDSVGTSAKVVPGEANIMIAGKGITHSEFSTEDTTVLHGAQLWFALPEEHRHMDPEFHHYVPEVLQADGTELRVFSGTINGHTSPMEMPVELIGAELVMEPNARFELTLAQGREYGLLIDSGSVTIGEQPAAQEQLIFLGDCPDEDRTVTLVAGDTPTRLLILGGKPFGEQIMMWWNFIGRTHEEIVEYRARYQAEIGAEGEFPTDGEEIFGSFPDGQPAALPAPTMPTVKLRPRGND
ncbi:pirin family protein [Micrococcoides hystricis]|uniref:Pirin family protein n=1 Tax=Micrococcoides hystricis TaxID=1572761 RepID=A0ABV6P7L2_9MICC